MTTAPVMTITDELLAELDSVASAVSDGEWFDAEGAMSCTGICRNDAEFIAAANPTTILALTAHIRSLEARLEKAEKDAERYRWLRGNGSFAPSAWGSGWALACGSARYNAAELDASVDAAIAQEGSQHE